VFGALALLVTSVSLAHVQTLAVVPQNVTDFAQSQRYLGWTTERSVVVHDLRTGATSTVAHESQSSSDDVVGDDLVVAGDRAYWTTGGGSNLTRFQKLMSSAVSDPKVRELDFEAVYAGGDQELLAPVSDGRDVYFWEAFDGEGNLEGPLVRHRGQKGRALTANFGDFKALAAGDGRYAFARTPRDCVCAWTANWSPDGSRIAYWDRGRGEIWAINVDGTDRHGLGLDGTDPDWSPDGTKIAFARRNGGIAVAASTGRDAHLISQTGRNPAWSPDGHRLAFNVQSTIWTANADGTDARPIAAGEGPDWSPDGKQLVFAGPTGDGLVIANQDGTNAHVWQRTGSGPAWSPNGRYIAFSGIDGVEVANVAGSIVYGANDRIDGELLDTWSPSWSPDSNRLAYAGDLEFTDNGGPHLFLDDLHGEQAELTFASEAEPTPLSFHEHSGRTIVRMADAGNVVALAVSRGVSAALVRDGSDNLRVAVFKPRRRTVRIRTDAGDFQAAGSTIVFRSNLSIYTLTAGVGRPRLIARAASRPLGLSIVGRRIAWAENRGRHAVIRAVILPN